MTDESRTTCWSIARFGEPADVLERGSVVVEEPDARAVLVDVEAIGLNFLDVSVCRGDYGQAELPLVPGAEFAGRVVAVGNDVTEVAPGDRVAGMNPAARGAFARRVIAPSTAVHPVPDAMSVTDAAALLVTYQTAWFALVRRANLAEGEWLLVHAGAGGVGTAAIQIARARGARVIATASSEEKRAVCASYGAEMTVDYRREDFCQAVLAATGGRGADVVLDPVGGDVFARSLECSALEARVIPIGWASGTRPALEPEDLLRRNVTIVGLSWGSAYPWVRPDLVRDAHSALLREYAEGAVRPHVPRVWPFDELPAAVQALADGRVIGKAVVAGA